MLVAVSVPAFTFVPDTVVALTVPPLTVPLLLISPATSSFVPGEAVPTPTFPPRAEY